MKSNRIARILPALLACAASLSAEDNRIHWLNNYRDALREAQATQKPIFLEFRCEP